MPSFGTEGSRLLFAGPTYAGLDPAAAERAGFELRPPARRGDIAAVADAPPGIIALVDGRFHQCLSVGHAELRLALERGWTVWGLGSIGAIRAFEMRHLGMRGFGRVYEHFLGDEDFQDDELALLHTPDPPYRAASEPLVHLRHFIAYLERAGSLDPNHARHVVDALKGMWFGDRSLVTTVALIESTGGPAAAAAARERIAEFDRCRVKTLDLSSFLTLEPWRRDEYVPSPAPAPYSRTPLGGRPAAPVAEPLQRT